MRREDLREYLIGVAGLWLLIVGILATFLLPDNSPWVVATGFMALCGGFVLLYPVAMRLWGSDDGRHPL